MPNLENMPILKTVSNYKKWWHPVLTAVVTLACAWLASKAEEFNSGRDERDKDIIRLLDIADRQAEQIAQLRIGQATTQQSIEWMLRRAGVSSGALITATPPVGEIIVGSSNEEPIDIDEDRLRHYQHTRSR